MPDALDVFPQNRIDWTVMRDGRPYHITKEEIEEAGRTILQIQQRARDAARYYGMRCRTRTYMGGVAVQFFDPNKEES